MENLTHWKKNNDSRYISGEDLKASLHDLKPEMNVYIKRFEDAETFDQKSQNKITKTGFFLCDLSGKDLYKPVILNNTNADFCRKEFKSDYLEHWLNKPFTIYAKPDARHGFVVRFKKYYAPATISDVNALKIIESSKDLEELKKNFLSLSKDEKKLISVVSKTESLKLTLK